MNHLLGIVLLILGGMFELAGVLCLNWPQLKYTVPRAIALAMLVLGGILTGAGMLTFIITF